MYRNNDLLVKRLRLAVIIVGLVLIAAISWWLNDAALALFGLPGIGLVVLLVKPIVFQVQMWGVAEMEANSSDNTTFE